MCYWSLPDLQALADNYEGGDVSLSAFSVALIMSTLDFMSDKHNWGGADLINGLSDAEKDEIDTLVSALSKAFNDATI